MTLLQSELGVDPDLTTKQLYERLLLSEEIEKKGLEEQQHFPIYLSPSPCIPVSPFVGRDTEWAIIQRWLAVSNTRTSLPQQ